MIRAALAVLLALLAGCHRQSETVAAPSNRSELEAAAITAGVISDPDTSDPTGLFVRDRDKLCVVPSDSAFRVGIYVDYGDDQACRGTGRATRAGEILHIVIDSAPGCAFDVRFEGDRIVFPGRVPDGCDKICSRRASIAGMIAERLSDSPSEAAALRDGNGRPLCAGGS